MRSSHPPRPPHSISKPRTSLNLQGKKARSRYLHPPWLLPLPLYGHSRYFLLLQSRLLNCLHLQHAPGGSYRWSQPVSRKNSLTPWPHKQIFLNGPTVKRVEHQRWATPSARSNLARRVPRGRRWHGRRRTASSSAVVDRRWTKSLRSWKTWYLHARVRRCTSWLSSLYVDGQQKSLPHHGQLLILKLG